MGGRSAVIVPITLPPALRRLRDASDPMAARGVPAHVTILFPFLDAADLGPADRAALAVIAGRCRAVVARFDRVERRDGVVWLMPADPAPFLALTAAVVDTWPNHPPYDGAHDVLIAHVTLVESGDRGTRERVASRADAHGPFEAPLREILVITESGEGTWSSKWRIPLATEPGRRP